MKFSDKLVNLRKESKMSQENLADKLDISRQAVSKWESGQAYPEMDKLLSLCKIFNVTLEELTNDEVKELRNEKNSKPSLSNLVDELMNIIKKTMEMLKNMRGKEIAKMIVEMIIIFILLLLLGNVFDYVYHLGKNIFINFGENIGNLFSSIWYFIINITYIIVSIFIFISVFKMRYLDKHDGLEMPKKLISNETDETTITEEDKSLKKENIILNKQPREKSKIAAVLSSLFMIFIKAGVAIISVPFAGIFIFLVALTLLSILLIFKKLFFLSAILLSISATILIYSLLKMLISFILNIKQEPKKILVFILISLFGLGIGGGLLALDVTTFTYTDTPPTSHLLKTKEEVIPFNKQLLVGNRYYDPYHNTTYRVDETLTNEVKVLVKYYANFTDYIITTNGDQLYIYNDKKVSLKGQLEETITALQNRKIYDFNLLNSFELEIVSSSENINALKKELDLIDEEDNKIYLQENIIEQLEDEIDELNNKLGNKEQNYNELKEEIKEVEQELKEYKTLYEKLEKIINE